MNAREMQTSEEMYALFLINPFYAKVKNIIYRFKNLKNGKVYIGQTTKTAKKRVIQHITNSRDWTKPSRTYFHNALNKYGFSNFSFDVIEICGSNEELNIRERYWIQYYRSTNKKFGYNIDSGGSLGKKTSPLTKEHKHALFLANYGKHRSDETKLAISTAHKLKYKLDPELAKQHGERLKKYSYARQINVFQYNLDGILIKTWKSIKETSRYLYNGNSSSCLKRNILTNMNKHKKLGFYKDGYILSFLSPLERGTY